MPEEYSAIEATWLKASFELRCLSGSFVRQTKRFEASASQILQTVNDHDYDMLSRTPRIPRLMGMRRTSREWSVFMVIDHLRRHTDFVLQEMRSLLTDSGGISQRPSFHYFVPDDAGAECIDQFQDSVWQYLGFVGNLEESRDHRRSTGSIEHPLLGRLNLVRLNAYAGFHLSIHRSQIQKILATEGVV